MKKLTLTPTEIADAINQLASEGRLIVVCGHEIHTGGARAMDSGDTLRIDGLAATTWPTLTIM